VVGKSGSSALTQTPPAVEVRFEVQFSTIIIVDLTALNDSKLFCTAMFQVAPESMRDGLEITIVLSVTRGGKARLLELRCAEPAERTRWVAALRLANAGGGKALEGGSMHVTPETLAWVGVRGRC
jgi:hypothetical protein